MINLRKLAEQQESQRALKIKNKILKQTHDIKIAESLSPITKNLSELLESTRKLAEIVKVMDTPQLAIENTHTALPIKNERIHPGVIYDASLENTLSNMQNQKSFLKIEERNNGDIIWNGFPVEKVGGKKLEINDKIYNISDDLQKVFTNTSNIPLKKVNDKTRECIKIFLKVLILRIIMQYVVKINLPDINILKKTLKIV